ncbi:TetR family transcriptional regulator [Pseudonocardia bannensis]|uniref:TetR/AcrR family transcriptional regulator n=1 Tax=Pseudonocardia bannensis TaxID=630973 RepID=A0A848DEL4_9PSEU|nr:TetR family transcriptional regulator [Pseudonocardia bannensis]NMH91052.1 TetR/AcrR family transcriptional regulator [Pseudonocardia bannensis]
MTERRPRFPGAARSLLRDAVLDAAGRTVLEVGWQAARMADIAAAVGVSRQTLYAEFGSKQALMQALVVREAQRLVEALGAVLQDHPDDAGAAVRAGCEFVLRRSRADDLVKTIVSGPDETELLPLVTTEAAPIVGLISRAFTDHFGRCRPGTEQRRAELVGDTLARLIITHVLLPDHAVEFAAEGIAEVLGSYLREMTADAGRPRET